jgi:hypothetical protein
MKYNGDYVHESFDTIKEQYSPDYDAAVYTIEVDDVFKDPPILELCKFMQDTADIELQDRMVRYCVLGRQVTVYLDGESVGSFRRNGFDDAWEVCPVINEHPIAYKLLADIVVCYLLKKSTPPRKKTSTSAAVAK